MPQILLIQPPVRDFYLTAKRTIPYGLASIAAVLIQAGFSVQILDMLAVSRSRVVELPPGLGYLRRYYQGPDSSPFALFHDFKHFGYSYEFLGKKVREAKPFLAGISSLFTPYHDDAVKTAETVKANHPACKTVVGGHHATSLPEALMDSRAVDYVLRGEGEVSMPQFARAVLMKSEVSRVPGIVYRRPGGRLRIKEPAYMEHPDRYPPPAVHLLKHKHYQRGRRGGTVVVASRGCPMSCSYCSMGKSSGIKYRKRDIPKVMAEIKTAVQKYDAGFIDFEDENISLDRKWFLGLLRGIQTKFKGEGFELRAMNGLYPPSLDEEMIRNMKMAGFKTLNLSLGSTSIRQLDRFNRENVTRDFERALIWAGKYGMNAVGYVITGAPNQAPEDSVQDLLYLAEHRVLGGVSVFYPSPGSDDYLTCRNLGILPDHFQMMRSSALPISHRTTRKESATILRLGRILNFMKTLADHENRIPGPAPVPGNLGGLAGDRLETGKVLLKAFLNDGVIRGIDPDSRIFPHNTSTNLSELFIQGMKYRKIKGCGGGACRI